MDFEQSGSALDLPFYLQKLNEPQKRAATTTEGPLIVLAGAGSGKTSMLTSRIAYLIDQIGVPAHQILAVTFTNKAAQEMRERVRGILNQVSGVFFGSPEIGTFHSVCMRILRRERAHTPFTKPFVVYDDSDQLTLIKSVMTNLGLDTKTLNPKKIKAAINTAKCDALEPSEIEVEGKSFFERQFQTIYEAYQKQLFASNALDFGEIITMTYRLLRDVPEVRQKYQNFYKYVHVDEYQDTNRAQYLLLSTLVSPAYGGHQNICVVGDEDQSIYGWRGADIRNILDFEKDYPGAQTVKLEQNYRSTQTIIASASRLIANNTQRKDKTLWTDNPTGVPIVCYQVGDERAEAETVISEIKKLARDEGHSFDDFAVFYRTHAQSRQFEDVLRREKVQYKVVGGLRFYDRKEIKDILAYFKLIMNPSDSVSLRRVINVPSRGIGKTTLERLDAILYAQAGGEESAEGSDADLWSLLTRVSQDGSVFAGRTAGKLRDFVTLMRELMEKQPELQLSELYHLILDRTGYVTALKEEGTIEALARIENLEEFDTVLQEFEAAEKERKKEELLEIFLEQSALQSEVEGGAEVSLSAVKLMTLHSSKGLEFPVVFLVGMEAGLFPSGVQAGDPGEDGELEEERRLCYVGMTRARERLYLSCAEVRRLWGQVSYQEPSQFLSELPRENVEVRKLGGRSVLQPAWRTPYRQQRPVGVSQPSPTPKSSGVRVEYDGEFLDGRMLQHPEYGKGKIVGSEGFGTDQKVTVEFSGRVRRKFLFRYVEKWVQG